MLRPSANTRTRFTSSSRTPPEFEPRSGSRVQGRRTTGQADVREIRTPRQSWHPKVQSFSQKPCPGDGLVAKFLLDLIRHLSPLLGRRSILGLLFEEIELAKRLAGELTRGHAKKSHFPGSQPDSVPEELVGGRKNLLDNLSG